jgi:hypothetical protein
MTVPSVVAQVAARSSDRAVAVAAQPGDRAASGDWYRFSLADAVFLVLAVGILVNARGGTLDDPGLGWHIRDIDAIQAQKGWLTEDPFSGPRAGQPWYTNQWLGDLMLWLGDRWGGLTGIAAVTALVLAFTYRCLYGMLRTDGISAPAAALWTFLAALGSYTAWQARPNLLSMLFLLLTVRVCERFHDGKCTWRRLLWLGPLFAVWANTHGGFVGGLLTLAVAVVIEAALGVLHTDPEKRRAARERSLHLSLATLGAVLCTLLNPYGWKLYPWIFQLLGNPYFMDLNFDWRSSDFHAPGAFRFELLMLLFPAVLALSRRRPNLVGLGLSLVWLHLALNGQRYVPLWVMAATPTMARAALGIPWLRAVAERFTPQGFASSPARPVAWLGTAAVALGILIWAHFSPSFAQHNPALIPAAALDRVIEESKDGNLVVFHEYNWGGYLTWHGWPGFRTWIDDRNEVQGEAHIKEFFAIRDAEPGWKEKLKGVEIVAVRPATPLAQRLATDPSWRRIYRDEENAVVFRRIPTDSAEASP